MAAPATDEPTTRWSPPARAIDGAGVALLFGFAVWAWWVSRVHAGDAGPLVRLVLAAGVVAALARWATFFSRTVPPVLIVAGVIAYALVTGGDAPRVLGPEDSAEAAGALLAIGTGAAGLVVLRAELWWLRALAGLVGLTLALLTWRTGSWTASAIALFVVVATVTLVVLPMRERRWVVVWPGLVAVLVLFGSLTYAALPIPGDRLLGAFDADRVERWSAALDAVTESPLYGTGPGVSDPVVGDGLAAAGWVRHEPLEVTAETGVLGGLLLLAVLWWALAWVARPGGGPGSVVGGVVLAGSIAHACLEPIWHVPAVTLPLAALAGTASLRGGDAAWRLRAALTRAGGSGGDDGHGAVDAPGGTGGGSGADPRQGTDPGRGPGQSSGEDAPVSPANDPS